MGRRLHIPALAALIGVAALPAPAADQVPVMVSATTSYQLAEACRTSRSPLELDFCTGYILGAMDQLALDGAICTAGDSVSGRALAVVRKYVADHPERWDRHPARLVEEGLRLAFPCRGRHP